MFFPLSVAKRNSCAQETVFFIGQRSLKKSKTPFWLMVAVVMALTFFSGASAQAFTYYYTGVSETAPVAHFSQARMRMDEHPKCKLNVCHAIAWTTLWDVQVTGQYVEAGIGYFTHDQCKKSTTVALWWASPQAPHGTAVGCVPRGTEVKVSVYREDGEAGVLAVWQWEGGEVSQWVETPGWLVGPGIHPTKVEVYAYQDGATPSPVSMTISDVVLFPEDTQAFLQQTPPYWAASDHTTTFSVEY